MILPGDGIGPEVITQARRVLELVVERASLDVEITQALYGAAAYPEYKRIISDEALSDTFAADAILFGAIGGDAYDALPPEARREGGLLQLRKQMQLFANLRPIVGFRELADASSLKPERLDSVNVLLLRELNGGLYFGQPRGISDTDDGVRFGRNTMVYSELEIERVARFAFELAGARDKRLMSVDKANVLETSRLWREVVTRIGAEEYPGIALDHMFVDNCAMQLAGRPGQFDTIVTENTFGDILSDIGGAVAGSLGMLPSASLSAVGEDGRRKALYEPVHGSAPDITGQGIANPLAAILCVAMLLRHSLERADLAAEVELAVRSTVGAGVRTPDIAASHPTVSTREMGDAVLQRLAETV